MIFKITSRFMIMVLLLCGCFAAHAKEAPKAKVISKKEVKAIKARKTKVAEKYSFKKAVFPTPFDHSKKDSPKLMVPYILVQTKETKGKVPIFFLRGGPGFSGTEVARDLQDGKKIPAIYMRLLEKHPIYFIDQRGTGIFKPNMWCDTSKKIKNTQFDDAEGYVKLVKRQLKYCQKNHRKFPLYEDHLDTLTVANDLEALRKGIKADKIILFGESYGTYLALTYMHDFQEHLEKVILIGVAGPDDLIFMPKRYGQAIKKLDAFRKSRNLEPIEPKLKAALEKIEQGESPWGVNKYEFLWFVMDNFYLKNGDRIMEILNDDVDGVIAKHASERPYKLGFNFKYFTTVCASFGSNERFARAAKQAETALLQDATILHYQICDALNLKQLPKRYLEPVVSDVPTIAFSGGGDLKTPAQQATEVGKGFSKFIHVIEKKGTHTFCKKAECNDALDAFLAATPKDIKSKTIVVD